MISVEVLTGRSPRIGTMKMLFVSLTKRIRYVSQRWQVLLEVGYDASSGRWRAVASYPHTSPPSVIARSDLQATPKAAIGDVERELCVLFTEWAAARRDDLDGKIGSMTPEHDDD